MGCQSKCRTTEIRRTQRDPSKGNINYKEIPFMVDLKLHSYWLHRLIRFSTE